MRLRKWRGVRPPRTRRRRSRRETPSRFARPGVRTHFPECRPLVRAPRARKRARPGVGWRARRAARSRRRARPVRETESGGASLHRAAPRGRARSRAPAGHSRRNTRHRARDRPRACAQRAETRRRCRAVRGKLAISATRDWTWPTAAAPGLACVRRRSWCRWPAARSSCAQEAPRITRAGAGSRRYCSP